MKIRLGYVAIALTLEPLTSSSMMTYAHYRKLGKQRGDEKLHKIILSNLGDLQKILTYNVKNDIAFYRMTSNLIPLATHSLVTFDYQTRYDEEFRQIGNYIKENNLRIDTHPDQFCVLNSERKEVVASSINILQNHQFMFDKMGVEGYMVLHIGGGAGGKKAGMQRFKDGFNQLDENIQRHIILENDDKVYTIKNTLQLCQELKIPMVLDYHHYLCNHKSEKLKDLIEAIFATWDPTGLPPKIHFSSPKNKKEKRSHNDYIDCEAFLSFLEMIRFTNRDVDIMLEAKAKDLALFRLIRQIKYQTDYKFVKNIEFYI